MEKDRGFRALAIIAIIVSVVGITIGFASLNQTLNINTQATLKGSDWSVKFSNLGTPVLTGSGTGTATLDADAAIMTVTANLKAPGDKVVYTFDVVNDGDIDAKLSATPVFEGDTATATAAHINYSLAYAPSGTPTANDPLAAEQTRSLVLTIEYDASVTEVPTADTTFNLTVAMLYTQD